MPLQWFFPERYGGRRAREIRGLCDTCPVREECLDFSLGYDYIPGIWGGMNFPQRRRLKAARNRERRTEEEGTPS